MRIRRLPWLAIATFALAATASGQALVCPPAASIGAHACEVFHYHVAMYRPDSRTFQELYGVNQFASQSACERARDAAVKRNLATVERIRLKDQKYEADRFGQCHCDMTVDRASGNFLGDLQRIGQTRAAEEVRKLVKERLLDYDVPTDSDAVRGLTPPPNASPLLGGAKLVPLPAAGAIATVTNPASDLKATRTTESSAPSTASLDLPLVEIPTAESAAPAATQVTVTAPASPATAGPAPEPVTPASGQASLTQPSLTQPSLTQPSTTQPFTQPSAAQPATTEPAAAPLPETKVAEPATPQLAPATEAHEEAPQPADETAESFVTYETERIQNVLKASGAIGDENVKSKIFEACMQRIQLLSNLRSLIQGSGARSRLATTARNIKSEDDRLALVGALFGSDMPPHWAPHDAKDVILEPRPELDNDTEKVLRDSGSRYTLAQKKHALYVLLAHSQPTEEQQLWLSTIVDGFLQ